MKNNTLKMSFVGLVVTCGLAAGSTTAVAAQPTASVPLEPTGVTSASNQAAEIEAELNYLMSIPDSILLEGDAALHQWTAQNPPAGPVTGVPGDQVGTNANVFLCTGAIAAAIAGVALPAAKILKIKKLMNELGGVTEAVQLMWGASFSYEKMAAAGGAFGALAAEFVGIAGIQQECFN